MNLEVGLQMARRATFPPGEAKEDWAIVRAVSEYLNKTLPFDSAAALRDELISAVPSFAVLDEVLPSKWAKFGRIGKLSDEPVSSSLNQFHMTCAISRSSETMAACHQSIQSASPSLAAE